MAKLTTQEKILKSKQMTIGLKKSFLESVERSKDIVSPIYLSMEHVKVPDKKCALNLNSYRNRAFHMNNQLKKQYKELMRDQLEWKTFKTPIWITYTIYYSHKSDLMNVVSIVDKFFCDALVEYWCIPDDNVEHVTEIHSVVWGKDREHPRCEITII